MKDLHNHIHVKRGLSPVAAGTDNTAYVSQVCDRQGYESVEFLILIGANTDADVTFTTLFEDSDDNVTYAAVADANLLGTEALASFQFDDDNEVRKIGYTGGKRYSRVTITPANNAAGNIFIAGAWLLGQAAVLYCGKLLVFERGVQAGHTPIPYARQRNVISPRSQSGEYLGRVVVGGGLSSSVSIIKLSAAWYRSTLDPFFAVAAETPFFWAWSPQSYPDEVGYVWLSNQPVPNPSDLVGYIDIQMQLEGLL